MTPGAGSRESYLPLLLLAVAASTGVAQQRAAADPEAVSALLAAARGANPVMCELAARSVESQWGWGGMGPWSLRTARDPSVRSTLTLVNHQKAPAAAIPALAAALGDDDACVRRMAAPLLGRIDTPSSLAALRQAMRDERAATREAAAFGLGFSGNPAAIPALLGGLQDAVPRVRVACALALGDIEDHRAIGALVRLLREDRDDEVRAAAAWALGEIEG